jgi:hypothetical protein
MRHARDGSGSVGSVVIVNPANISSREATRNIVDTRIVTAALLLNERLT